MATGAEGTTKTVRGTCRRSAWRRSAYALIGHLWGSGPVLAGQGTGAVARRTRRAPRGRGRRQRSRGPIDGCTYEGYEMASAAAEGVRPGDGWELHMNGNRP